MAAIFVILLIFLFAVVGPMVYRINPADIDTDLIGMPQSPSAKHLAGTDGQGRDQLARLMAGARISLAVGVVSCFINIVIGVGVGVAAGLSLIHI